MSRQSYPSEPVHQNNGSIDWPLHVPDAHEYWLQTGRRLVALDTNQYFENAFYTLVDDDGPVVLGSFAWSALAIDGLRSINLTKYFTTLQTLTRYNYWRIRGLWRGGYMIAYYGTVPSSPSGTISAMSQSHVNFTKINNGYALSLGPGNLLNKVGDQYLWTGGVPGQPIAHYFPTNFQIELGWGHPLLNLTSTTGDENWPAFTAGVKTDLLGYRAYSGNTNCFGGLANAPNVPDSCPFKDLDYTPPEEP